MAENRYYERKIRYLDYVENGERIGGVGFARTELQGSRLKLSVTVRGLYPTDTFTREVELLGDDSEKSIGQISLREGSGSFEYLDQSPFQILQGIRIALGGGREVVCRWQVNKAERTITGASDVGRKEAEQRGIDSQNADCKNTDCNSTEQKEKEQKETEQKETEQKTLWDRLTETVPLKTRTTEKEPLPEEEEFLKAAESTGHCELSERQTEAEKIEKNADSNSLPKQLQEPESKRQPVRLSEDKWLQLWAIYPHIRPFRDQREYLSIGPADFVLLSSRAYRTVNNSFLLHGFYNYEHLILTRIERRGEVVYYIGVPGNYYEREKQVAVMFGFESFECAQEPAQTGDFGYYMMRTEL